MLHYLILNPINCPNLIKLLSNLEVLNYYLKNKYPSPGNTIYLIMSSHGEILWQEMGSDFIEILFQNGD